MNDRVLILVFAAALVSGCVSKTGMQAMIDAHHSQMVTPRLMAMEQQVELVERRLQTSQATTDMHRDVLINHFELLRQLSEHALSQLKKEQEEGVVNEAPAAE